MDTVFSKYNYEKIWRPTSIKDLKRIVAEELSEAPVEETVAYIVSSCKAGKRVNFADISFQGKNT